MHNPRTRLETERARKKDPNLGQKEAQKEEAELKSQEDETDELEPMKDRADLPASGRRAG